METKELEKLSDKEFQARMEFNSKRFKPILDAINKAGGDIDDQIEGDIFNYDQIESEKLTEEEVEEMISENYRHINIALEKAANELLLCPVLGEK